MKTSADEMGYGLTVLWLAVTVMFFAVAAMWNGHGVIGYFLLSLGVLGLLRSARHMREGFEIAKAEDAAREAQWRRWAEEIGCRNAELGCRNEEVRGGAR